MVLEKMKAGSTDFGPDQKISSLSLSLSLFMNDENVLHISHLSRPRSDVDLTNTHTHAPHTHPTLFTTHTHIATYVLRLLAT